MTIDLKAREIQPLRHTYAHVAQYIGGDKHATRYQEATYDIQSEVNHHYKPLWDPERDLYDKRRTAVEMADWYALKDPRQYYYAAYTMARARQQDAAEKNFDFVEKRDLLATLPVSGVDGTLRRSPMGQGIAHLKTGSLADVQALCTKHALAISTIEALTSGGARVVMLNPDGADRMRDLMKTRLIESPVVRSSLHLARQPRSVLR